MQMIESESRPQLRHFGVGIGDGIEFDLAVCIARALELETNGAQQRPTLDKGYLDETFPEILEALSLPQFRKTLEELYSLAWSTALAPLCPNSDSCDLALTYRAYRIEPRSYSRPNATVSSKFRTVGISKICREHDFRLLPVVERDVIASGTIDYSLLPVGAVVSIPETTRGCQLIGFTQLQEEFYAVEFEEERASCPAQGELGQE